MHFGFSNGYGHGYDHMHHHAYGYDPYGWSNPGFLASPAMYNTGGYYGQPNYATGMPMYYPQQMMMMQQPQMMMQQPQQVMTATDQGTVPGAGKPMQPNPLIYATLPRVRVPYFKLLATYSIIHLFIAISPAYVYSDGYLLSGPVVVACLIMGNLSIMGLIRSCVKTPAPPAAPTPGYNPYYRQSGCNCMFLQLFAFFVGLVMFVAITCIINGSNLMHYGATTSSSFNSYNGYLNDRGQAYKDQGQASIVFGAIVLVIDFIFLILFIVKIGQVRRDAQVGNTIRAHPTTTPMVGANRPQQAAQKEPVMLTGPPADDPMAQQQVPQSSVYQLPPSMSQQQLGPNSNRPPNGTPPKYEQQQASVSAFMDQAAQPKPSGETNSVAPPDSSVFASRPLF